jgi:hypothetical protein
MTDYKEIIVAIIAVVGGVLPYLFQRNKENLKIAEQKREAYANFLKNFPQFNLSVDSRLPERKPEQFQGRMAVMIG